MRRRKIRPRCWPMLTPNGKLAAMPASCRTVQVCLPVRLLPPRRVWPLPDRCSTSVRRALSRRSLTTCRPLSLTRNCRSILAPRLTTRRFRPECSPSRSHSTPLATCLRVARPLTRNAPKSVQARRSSASRSRPGSVSNATRSPMRSGRPPRLLPKRS